MSVRIFFLISLLCVLAAGCEKDEPGSLRLNDVFVGDTRLSLHEPMTENVQVDRSVSLIFSLPVSPASAQNGVRLLDANGMAIAAQVNVVNGNTISVFPNGPLQHGTVHTIELTDQIRGAKGERFASQQIRFKTVLDRLEVTDLLLADIAATGNGRILNVPVNLSLTIKFSVPVKLADVQSAFTLAGPVVPSLNHQLSADGKALVITGSSPLKDFAKYTFSLASNLKGVQGEVFSGYSRDFFTGKSVNSKFPAISDEELLTKVQSQTFRYFWDFAHPASGMARERNTSGDLVTSGGSGFGIMALIVGMERNFISRDQGLQRMEKILSFLEVADRFHGAWSHWINGNTGDVIPFSANDNGGDLVETSFLIQGLITFRQYLDPAVVAEQALIDRINTLWYGVEWDWYTRGGRNVLFWHWSPDKEWTMNHAIAGYNECLITYVLAASSPTHSISKAVYTEGWARNGAIANGRSFYSMNLPLGEDFGGPLFFAHYSFLGLDPRNLKDTHGDYWIQNVNHSLINRAYGIANPRQWVGYSGESWGLTASDNHQGYSAHSPTNDLGVISPTAALSSFPYTPSESLQAMRFFYYSLGDRLWGDYGFYDAFNLTEDWVANSYLAIDQGPIVVMIENHRTGLLWNLFMSAPEVKNGLNKLSFTY